MTFDMDDRLLAFINEMIDTSDTILLGRKMTRGSSITGKMSSASRRNTYRPE
jgi:hypothetical protein